MARHQEFIGERVVPIGARPREAKSSISVIGLGYVGAVSCACLTALGHRVVGVDIDTTKTDLIAEGRSPIHEHELETLLTSAVTADLLSTTTSTTDAVAETDVTFVSVGTPTSPDGGCDFRFIEAAARDIGHGVAGKDTFHVVVLRCSVPPGTTMQVMAPIIETISGRELGKDFGICFNPEFLREGVAVDDFRRPPKTVIGATDPKSSEIIAEIFEPVDDKPILCTVEDAELVKYVDNVWHATKVCFANEVGRLAKSYGVDGHNVMSIFVKDRKLNISEYYLKPGFAYGGSCLPKEVRAVNYLAKERKINLPLIGSLGESNKTHIDEAIRMARESGARKITILGVAFKSGTDDLRESPILDVMAALLDEGIELSVHDNAINFDTNIEGQMSYVSHGAPGLARLAKKLPDMLAPDLDKALDGAEAVIVTHRDDGYARKLSTRKDLRVIDVVRLFDDVPKHPEYAGIGW